MEFVLLTSEFYKDYPNSEYPQLMAKPTRPYTHVKLDIYDAHFYIPFRSNIEHPHAFFTNKREKCGIDYSKAIVINDEKYIDNTQRAHIRKNEFKKVKGKDYKLKRGFEEYIELYKKAKNGEEVSHREDILSFSSLQYFEEYILDSEDETVEKKAEQDSNEIKEKTPMEENTTAKENIIKLESSAESDTESTTPESAKQTTEQSINSTEETVDVVVIEEEIIETTTDPVSSAQQEAAATIEQTTSGQELSSEQTFKQQ